MGFPARRVHFLGGELIVRFEKASLFGALRRYVVVDLTA
jgi:hypothetical protein